MTKFALAAVIAATLATPAFAQAVVETPTSTTVVVPPGAPRRRHPPAWLDR